MRIVSWNVNGLRARKDAVERLVSEYQPDILCYQKVRVKMEFPEMIDGYICWAGTMEPTLVGGVATFDGQSRQDTASRHRLSRLDRHRRGRRRPDRYLLFPRTRRLLALLLPDHPQARMMLCSHYAPMA